MPKQSPSSPSGGADCADPAAKTTATCEKVGYELVDLIEVVVQDEEKLVKGAAGDTTDTAVVKKSVERKDKAGAHFKQYINLDPAHEGAAKTHPEYGRTITLRARVKQKDGKTDKLAGVKVGFAFHRADGPNRTDPGGSEPAVWKAPELTAAQKEGFDSAGGAQKKTLSTDDKGWTAPLKLVLSQFAGDMFHVSCQLDPSVEGAAGSSPLKTKAGYVVWRKFWYQMTYADGYAAPRPTAAETAYGEVCAEMVRASEKKFTKADFPADLQDRTFMPEYQLKQGGGNKIVANVGDSSNIGEFATNAKLKLDVDPTQPVKENLIVCEYQCDPKGTSQLKDYKLTSNGQSISVAVGGAGPIISKPAIKASAKLVAFGEWSTKKSPWTKGGAITDANVEIVSTRASTQAVKINLPAGAPAPTAAKPVWVRLKLETCRNYLGWATAAGIVAVYLPAAAAGTQGSEADFNDTAAHELGHKFNQTPKPTKQPGTLQDHPLQYVAHGGSGSHCRHGATVAAGAVNWQDASQETPSPQDGDCIMYHRYSNKCSHKFCTVCKSYLQLEEMKTI